MPKLKIELLREGMIAGADIKNMDNMLLLPAGCVISERHINILSAWGISEIEVQALEDSSEAQDVLQQLAPEKLEELRAELKRIFWEPPDKHAVQAETFDLILRRKARQALGRH
jgi:hypothetical protein